MVRLFLLFLALFATPAAAQPRQNAIQPELVAETRAVPGDEVELAILMRTRPGWHGYWLNPGDAGLPMEVEWQLPEGARVGPLRYPVPGRLTIAGIMNYVYKRDFAILTRLKVPAGANGALAIRAKARWLACTDEICVPEQGEFALDVPTTGNALADERFDEWRRALPRPLSSPAQYVVQGGRLLVAVPLPADTPVGDPYLFPITDGVVDYPAEQEFRRAGDWLVADLTVRTPPAQHFDGVLALGDGRGLEFRAVPGRVPEGGRPVGAPGGEAALWAVLGALAGGLLLNLMPCVFPILALKASHLARSGGAAGEARRDALAYTAGAVIGTGALGLFLLAIRAAGTEAGWAFQLQDPRTLLVLLLLSVAITANLLGLYALPAFGGRARPAGSFGTGALAAFVATPCAGPFLGAALGTALLLPAAGALLVFAALGLGLALPFLLIGFVPALRSRLPRPGPWMERLQRILAIPMAATAAAVLWLLWRVGGETGLIVGMLAAIALAALLFGVGRMQNRGRAAGAIAAVLAIAIAVVSIFALPPVSQRPAASVEGAEPWSSDQVAAFQRAGKPVFVYFTADWCLSCKANEATAIGRDEVEQAFRDAGVEVLVGDWTNGEPAITRFLESRGRAGVPLYLWYEPGRAEPEELPQILTPGMLTDRARRPR